MDKGIDQMKIFFATPEGEEWVRRNISKKIEEDAEKLRRAKRSFPHLFGRARRKEKKGE